MTRIWIPAALTAATLLTAAAFALEPGLDLGAAALFFTGGTHFAGDTPLGNGLRKVFYWIPTISLLLTLALYCLRRLGRRVPWAPSGRGIMFLVITFAVGPGLITNTLLKDHSHRPRPYQTAEFGGDLTFQPFYRFDGACRRNCSFVSGEGATSAWTLGPALLMPPPWRGPAVAASLVFASCSGMLRMAFGGHYFSDAIFAVLFSWWVLWLGWVLISPRSAALRRASDLHSHDPWPEPGTDRRLGI